MNPKHFYKGYDESWKKKEHFRPYEHAFAEIDEDNVKFCQLVFSPDPLTGNPQSEVAYMLSGADEGFKAFLKEKLFNAIPEGQLAETSDEAESLVKKNIYTQEQFANVCREYVTRMMRETKSD